MTEELQPLWRAKGGCHREYEVTTHSLASV